MGCKGGLQKLHKFDGIFKEFQSKRVNYPVFKKLSIFALGSLWVAKYLSSSTRLKVKGNFILIKIDVNFQEVFGAHQHPLESVITVQSEPDFKM